MTSKYNEPENEANLRNRAVSRLTDRGASKAERASSSAALRVLFELASSPDTAPGALALLHELQVHQVELELQDEELRRSRAELEAALVRQIQLYDFMPVGCFTVDSGTVIQELNLTGSRMLGVEHDVLPGRTLEAFLTPDSGRAFKAMLRSVNGSGTPGLGAFELTTSEGAHRTMHAAVSVDPAGGHFLVAFMDSGAHNR